MAGLDHPVSLGSQGSDDDFAEGRLVIDDQMIELGMPTSCFASLLSEPWPRSRWPRQKSLAGLSRRLS